MSTEVATSLTNRLVAGRYDVLEPLGGDGPVIVGYRARDRSLNRIVTLRTVAPAYADRSDIRDSLREGLGRTVSLAHGGIARVYDVGEEPDGILYFVEEHVRGIDLKERIRRVAPFQLAAATTTAIAIAEALDYALARGVSHGDLRPRVILIGSVVTQAAASTVAAGASDNQLKLTGFGTAAAQMLVIADNETARRAISPYWAPEVNPLNGQPTPAADVFAFGVLVYELLTGALPSETGDSLSPASANSAVPAAMDGIVRTATAARPENRYPSVRDVLGDLRTLRDAMRYDRPLTWIPKPIVSAPIAPQVIPPTPPAAKSDLAASPIEPGPTSAPPTPTTAAVLAAPPAAASSTWMPSGELSPLLADLPSVQIKRRGNVADAPRASTAEPMAQEVATSAIDDPYRNTYDSQRSDDAVPVTREDRETGRIQSSRSVLAASRARPVYAASTDSVPANSATRAAASAYQKEEEAPLEFGNRSGGDYNDRERGGGGGRYLTSLNLFLLALVIGAVAVLLWQAATFLKPADDVVVPNLVGKTLVDARELAQQEKFDLAVVDSSQYREKEPEGVIYMMAPSPGRHIREGRSVSIWVSKGQPLVTVPDVTTMSLDKARQVLLDNYFKLNTVAYDFDPTIDRGLVISQTPKASDSQPRGSKVDVVVSKGPDDGSSVEPSSTPSAPAPESSPTPDPADRTRTFVIKLPAAKDGVPHHIRIDVTDRDGTRTAYDETQKPGDQVQAPIKAVGIDIHVRLFDNDKLIQDKVVK